MPADAERVASVLRAATSRPQTVDTRTQQVTIRTRRGNLRVGPHGKIDGLWRICKRELRTNEQVRELAGGIPRSTLIAWRARTTDPFPDPVLVIPAGGRAVDLWERTAVEDWLRRNGRI